MTQGPEKSQDQAQFVRITKFVSQRCCQCEAVQQLQCSIFHFNCHQHVVSQQRAAGHAHAGLYTPTTHAVQQQLQR